jgi:hypothetical protein
MQVEKLKETRNLILKLHKTLLDHERRLHEGIHGPINSGQFLNLLLEDRDFEWLREFSKLIVEIDEMFDRDDGFSGKEVDSYLDKARVLISVETGDEYFEVKYRSALQQNLEAASLQGELRAKLSE